jgi:putative SOS response-associated peptidase YedK
MIITPEMLAAVFGIANPPLVTPRYNIAPTQNAIIIRNDGTQNCADSLRWGLIPSWSKELSTGLINARLESAAEKPSFRSAFKRRRCIIPISGFYEWTVNAGEKHPFYIAHAEDQPMGVAGLYETWNPPEGEPLETFCLLTASANLAMQPIHDRMPVILPPSAYEQWLDPSPTDPAKLHALCQPFPDALITTRQVPDLVNNPRFDSPACIVPV